MPRGHHGKGEGQSPRVLIIEDNPSEAKALHDLLVWNGFEVAIAATARQGWSQLRAWRPDVVVLDLGLPDADGLTVCRAIKADPQLRDIPVLILTGRSAIQQLVEGLRIGAEDYVTKPYDPREILARIQAQLRLGQRIASLKTYHLRWWNLLRSFIPSSILQILQKAPHEIMGPARMQPLSVLAVSWGGLWERIQEAARHEGLPSGTLHQALNRHLNLFYESVQAEGGTPCPVVDGAALAWFNAPISCPDHPVRALRTALVLRERIRRLHLGLPPPLRFAPRFALHRGLALIGLMGGSAYLHYTPIGEVVEMTRRLSTLAPEGEILLTPAFHEAIQGLLPVQLWTEAPAFIRMPLYVVAVRR
ncbi:response regulator [Thermoflexus sp.]|uniref:response regulator n=1 Tax=Thermoflexus sp. TaxID=1969742 RepID=UPI0025F312DE|nr:response regulator [Thermoflexus sp.]MDW8179762.1 response regulator [Anaerolineae bacterium]MCS6963502.1 response regulator [Thermoflexus sp.]MCS7350311.1 response regulator [Thermoflexus sp.]MCX7689636.1 response regulator [Thermoflexus sp.]MDW8184788.1 response regulator [Anaerolineae bacterium]